MPVSGERVTVSRTIAAPAAKIWELVSNPQGHVDIDGSGMLEVAEDARPLTAVGDTFDIIDGPDGWNDDVGYGAAVASKPKFFCVTHSPPSSRRLVDHDFTFVPSVAAAVDAARDAASSVGKDVVVMGGGSVIAQALTAGLVDELVLHVSPLVLGAGTPLFTGGGPPLSFTQQSVVVSPFATHLTYSVVAA